MKRACSFVLASVLLLVMIAPVYAANTSNDIVKRQVSIQANENEAITAMNNSERPMEKIIKGQMLSQEQKDSGEIQAVLNQKKGPKENLKELKFKDELKLSREDAYGQLKETDELDYANVYKVVVYSADFGRALVGGKDLEASLSNAPYYWKVPIIKKETTAKIYF